MYLVKGVWGLLFPPTLTKLAKFHKIFSWC